MPLTNDIIIRLNEITTSVSSKKNLSHVDENMIKNIFTSNSVIYHIPPPPPGLSKFF